MNKLFSLVVVFVVFFTGCRKEENLATAVKIVSEYGTYHGMRKAEMTDDRAKYVEEGVRVALQVLRNESVDDFVDVDKVLNVLPAEIRPFIAEAIAAVDKRFVKLKGKIPTGQAFYLEAILWGAFDGTERYRRTLGMTVQTVDDVDLEAQYQEAKRKLDI